MFTVSVILVFDSKYVQFRIICSLLCSTTINTFKVDPHSVQYEKCLVKPTNSILFYSILFYSILFYSILFYSILFYSILFYSILFYSILFYSILFYSILHYSKTTRETLSKSILHNSKTTRETFYFRIILRDMKNCFVFNLTLLPPTKNSLARNPKVRVQIPLEPTNFSLVVAV